MTVPTIVDFSAKARSNARPVLGTRNVKAGELVVALGIATLHADRKPVAQLGFFGAGLQRRQRQSALGLIADVEQHRILGDGDHGAFQLPRAAFVAPQVTALMLPQQFAERLSGFVVLGRMGRIVLGHEDGTASRKESMFRITLAEGAEGSQFCEGPRSCHNLGMRTITRIAWHLAIVVALFTVGAVAQTNQGSKPAPAGNAPNQPQTAAPDAKPQAAAPQAEAIPELPTDEDKVSYAIGMNIGKGLHRDSIAIDPQLLLRGLQDALAGGKTLMTDQQAQATMVQLQGQVRERESAKLQQESDANKKAGDAFLAANKTKPGVIVLPSGLQYKILQAGTGPKPTIDDVVICNYRGTLLDGKEFDSSYQRGQPETFPVRGVIKGWTEALQLMPVGTKFQLFVPADLAYGEGGARGVIGPNQTLLFEVELLSIKDQSKKEPAPANPKQ